jgi:putative acetyltransferase
VRRAASGRSQTTSGPNAPSIRVEIHSRTGPGVESPIGCYKAGMQIVLRAVGPDDHASTRQVVDAAFRPKDVATFLDALRADGCTLGEWLAEDPSGTVGLIVFSRVWVEQQNGDRVRAAMLTPLAVRPDRQRLGIGRQLMDHALRCLEARGETLLFVLGHPAYYPRAGFLATLAQNVMSPWSGNPAFMARGMLVPEGRLVLPAVISDAH